MTQHDATQLAAQPDSEAYAYPGMHDDLSNAIKTLSDRRTSLLRLVTELPLPKAGKHKSIVIYLPTLDIGGVERLHLNLAPAFCEAGYDVTFLLQKRAGSLMHLVPKGVRIESLDCNRTLACLMPLGRYLRRAQPDILIANMGHNNIMAIWAVAMTRAKTRVIVSQHNSLSEETASVKRWQYRVLPFLYRLFLKRADEIVAVSQGVADDLAKVTGISRDRITVVYNPVVTPSFQSLMDQPVDHPWLARTQRPPVILGIGRFTQQKDFSTLLRAFAEVLKTRTARLILLGEGPHRQILSTLASELGIADHIDMPGFLPNPLPYMRQADLLVLSSRYEGFGNVLVEAMACGTPVVSTDCPHGPAEILADGRYGTLVPIGNVRAMAEAMRAALDTPLPEETLQQRASEFSVQSAAHRYKDLFGPSDE